MNFLSEVLSTAGETQMSSLKEKIPEIVSQIGKLKSEVVHYLKKLRIDFKLMKKKNNTFLDEANRLNSEMQLMTSEIETLYKRNTESTNVDLKNLNIDLEESLYALHLVTQLVEIDNYFKEIKECVNKKSYLEAIININTLNEMLMEIPAEEQLDLIEVLITSASMEYEIIMVEAKKVWNESIIYDKKCNESDDTLTLTIKINISRSDELKESIKALCYHNPYFYGLECFANFLMKDIFTSLINHTCKVEINDSTLTIVVNQKLGKQSYGEVFNNITNIIEFISVTINFEVKTDTLLLSLIGQKINQQFCELLIKNTLADTIPSSSDELAQYTTVAEKIQTLQDFLTECQFFAEQNISILEYAKNVDVLFTNKACHTYLDKARNILKKDLHDMMEVGTESVEHNLNDSSESVLVFPKCFISKNVLEYLDLIREVLDQASISSELCAGRFVFTADRMICLYCSFIPEYHKKLLETIPQQVALFHNNCMYIAREIFSLNKYKNEQVSMALKELNFSTQNEHVKVVGTDLFMKYIQSQIKQNEEILRQLEFTKLGETDQIDPNCEKYIRQCLRQLELLKTVWQKVLSYEVYNKTIGQLLNSFVGHLIKLVIGVEDISAINCTLLVEVFGIIKTRGPKLFTDPKEINLYVKQWYKFNELILLLNSSLTEINDRWADGKGPLAVEFTPDEVKGLIRALFQNTERRAAVLVRIN